MKNYKNKSVILIITLIFIVGLSTGLQVDNFTTKYFNSVTADDLSLDEQEATIRAIKKIMPSVVSVSVYDYEEIITINLITGERSSENEKRQMGSGTGFIISADGLILTNKHVVNSGKENSAEYQIILNSGKKYYAQLIGKDPINDLAVLKIFDKDLPFVELGDSNNLQIGSSVIAIGNVLGQYQNSVTKGIVSGLGRSIVASDQTGGNAEALDNVIQTDAEINFGNSGGPLVDLEGKVVGINVAIDQAGSAIGFAIPINDARPVIKSVQEIGRIIRSRLGVRYIMLTSEIAEERNASRNSGALIIEGDTGSPAIAEGSPASLAGLQAGDVIFEINAIKIDGNNTLLSVIQKYKPGDKIGMKVQRGNKVIIKVVMLDEFK
ncbi:MAG: trypsin-like peptidase domain-containing protein [Patescibacteria group bacterium]